MSVPMKMRRINSNISIQIGDQEKRLFLVPKTKAKDLMALLKDFEVSEDEELLPWRTGVQDLIDKYTEPGLMLKGGRTKEGISQTELAEKLGIPPSNISEMEHGKRPIGKKMAKRLSKILKVHYKVFL